MLIMLQDNPMKKNITVKLQGHPEVKFKNLASLGHRNEKFSLHNRTSLASLLSDHDCS